MRFFHYTAARADRPAWLDRSQYPFDSHYAALPQGRMHYLDEGHGRPIVMMHGNPGWSFEYRHVVAALRDSHRCIAPDYLGFGLSDKPTDWAYLPALHAQYVAAWLDALDLQDLTLVVNDWGGPIGLHYALLRPERIARLVILNTWLWPVQDQWHFRAFSGFMGGVVGRFLTRQFNFFGRVVVPLVMGQPSQLAAAVHRHYYAHMPRPDDRKGCQVFPRELIRSSAWLEHLWAQRDAIRHLPTTFVWGLRDPAFRPQELARWLTYWPQARVIRLPRVGHFPQEEAPEAVIAALRQE